MIENVIAPTYGEQPTIWAQLLNTSFTAMDAHDHSENQGLLLDSSIINFNNGFNCDVLSGWQLYELKQNPINIANTITTDGTDLIVYDGIARQIYVTKDGALNSPTVTGGGFTGDYVTSSAEVVYVSADQTYSFYDNDSNLSSIYGNNVSVNNFDLSSTMSCQNFVVSVVPSATLLFTLPVQSSAGVAYLSASSAFGTLPVLSANSSNKVGSQANINNLFYSFICPQKFISCASQFNSSLQYRYYFYQGIGPTRLPQDRQTFLVTFWNAPIIPFVECAVMQAVPVVKYTSGPNSSVYYYDPVIPYSVNTVTSNLSYLGTIGYQVTAFVTDSSGNPVSGGLGG